MIFKITCRFLTNFVHACDSRDCGFFPLNCVLQMSFPHCVARQVITDECTVCSMYIKVELLGNVVFKCSYHFKYYGYYII